MNTSNTLTNTNTNSQVVDTELKLGWTAQVVDARHYSFSTTINGTLNPELTKAFLLEKELIRVSSLIPTAIEHKGHWYVLYLGKSLAFKLKTTLNVKHKCLVSFQHFKDGRLIAVAKLYNKEKPPSSNRKST